MNVKVWLELEITYFKVVVQHFSSYVTETPIVLDKNTRNHKTVNTDRDSIIS